MTLLTVATVVRDDPVGFQRTMASLADQHGGDAEVVIVDGSADPVRALVPESLPFPVRVIEQEPRGIYPAMNSALEAARGEYVLFLNAGDTLADGSVLADVCARLAASQPTWAFGRVRFTDPSGMPLHEPAWDYARERDRAFARGLFPPHQGTVARVEVLREHGGFDPRYRIAADYAAVLRLSQASDPVRWDRVLADFAQGGASTKGWLAALREFHRARRGILRPTGRAALLERYDTVVHGARTAAHHAVASMLE